VCLFVWREKQVAGAGGSATVVLRRIDAALDRREPSRCASSISRCWPARAMPAVMPPMIATIGW
jgi:hypothetical protein